MCNGKNQLPLTTMDNDHMRKARQNVCQKVATKHEDSEIVDAIVET